MRQKIATQVWLTWRQLNFASILFCAHLLTPHPHRMRDAARHVTQGLGNHCCQLGCSHTQRAAVGVNIPTDNSGFQDVALRDALHHIVCVAGPLGVKQSGLSQSHCCRYRTCRTRPPPRWHSVLVTKPCESTSSPRVGRMKGIDLQGLCPDCRDQRNDVC